MHFADIPHFRKRLEERGLDENLAKRTYHEAREHYLDSFTGYKIAIAHIEWKGKIRWMALSYEQIGDEVIFVTIHLCRRNQIENRVKLGRWVGYEC